MSPRISIIVNNYNYARYLREAIDSALAVRWPDKEVIVVDDGSTDQSRDIIASFGDRIIPIYKPNGGQNSAVNAGFAVSTGDVVFVLDSDDALLPEVADCVMARMMPGVVRVQYRLAHVDRDGRSLGTSFPHFTPAYTPEWVRTMMAKTGFYEVSPASGGAWSRHFLAEVFPLPIKTKKDDSRWGTFFDAYLSMLAPYFGDVVTIQESLATYRIHGNNKCQIGKPFSLHFITVVCTEEIQRVAAANAVLAGMGKFGRISFEANSLHMQHRLILKRLRPKVCPFPDTLLATYRKYLHAAFVAEASMKQKLFLVAWGTIVVAAPPRVAYWFARMKEEPASRPRALKLLMG